VFILIDPAPVAGNAPFAAAPAIWVAVTQVIGITAIFETPSVLLGAALNGSHGVFSLTGLARIIHEGSDGRRIRAK
jgi:hypothetical protein